MHILKEEEEVEKDVESRFNEQRFGSRHLAEDRSAPELREEGNEALTLGGRVHPPLRGSTR